MSMIEAFFRAIPFAWVDWFFMTIAIGISHKHGLFTPTQDIFVLTILQFTLVLIINKFWLKQPVSRSDIICFFIILFGLFVSVNNVVSKIMGWEVPVHHKDEKSSV
jgi:drug/metabolite transporter (DMT)-like permease